MIKRNTSIAAALALGGVVAPQVAHAGFDESCDTIETNGTEYELCHRVTATKTADGMAQVSRYAVSSPLHSNAAKRGLTVLVEPYGTIGTIKNNFSALPLRVGSGETAEFCATALGGFVYNGFAFTGQTTPCHLWTSSYTPPSVSNPPTYFYGIEHRVYRNAEVHEGFTGVSPWDAAVQEPGGKG